MENKFSGNADGQTEDNQTLYNDTLIDMPTVFQLIKPILKIAYIVCNRFIVNYTRCKKYEKIKISPSST